MDISRPVVKISIEEWECANSQELNIIYNLIKQQIEKSENNLFDYLSYDKFVEFSYKHSTHHSNYLERNFN